VTVSCCEAEHQTRQRMRQSRLREAIRQTSLQYC